MTVDDGIRYGTAVWGWLQANPWLMILAGAVCFAGGVYYAVRPPIPKEADPVNQVQDALVSQPLFTWEEKGLVFKGQFSRAGSGLNAYVTYTSAGSVPAQPAFETLGGHPGATQPRIKVNALGPFDKHEAATLLVGTVSGVEGNQFVLQWGKPDLNATRVGITWASYFGCLILVEQGGKESRYPFAIMSRSIQNSPVPPVVVGPPLLSNCAAGL